MSKSAATDEQIKLRATFINEIGVGFIVSGSVGLGVGATLTVLPQSQHTLVALMGLAFLATGFVCHIYAARHIREIDTQ